MAFSLASFSLVRRLRGNLSEWNYVSVGDDPTVIEGVGYFNSAADRVRVGDTIITYGAGTPQVYAVAGNAAGVVTIAGIVTGGGGGGTINNDDWLGTDLAIVNGGTGASDAATARTNLGLAALATQSLVDNADWDSGGADLAVANGGTGASTAGDARTNLGLGTLATASTVSNDNWSGTDLAVANGGTGASTATDARTNLGLGSLATESTVDNADWSGADLAVVNGGTGASDAGTARTNLGLGTLATASTVNNDNWSGTDLTVANGGTGASDAATARINLGIAAASDTAAGIVELATTAETNTGTDNTRAVTPDGLAGSYAGTKAVSLQLTAMPSHDLVVGDGVVGFLVSASMTGMNLVSVLLVVHTAGSGAGTTDVQVRRRRAGSDSDMLSTKVTIDSTEATSATAATAAVINASFDDIATGDMIYADIDANSATAAKGGMLALEFRLP